MTDSEDEAPVEIHIYGPGSMLSNCPRAALPAVDMVTSYPVAGAEWSKAYRKGTWDGRKRLFRKRTGAFPTGLVPSVTEALRGLGLEVNIIDHRDLPTPSEAGFDLHGVKMEGKYDYQLEACKTMVEKKQGIVKISTNGGKCLRPDVRVRMFDGSVKEAQHVQVGDQLMGPDSKPRKVLSTTSGVGPMFEIQQKRGMSYGCNDVHVLTLQDTSARTQHEIVDIPLNEYLEAGSDFQHRYKHFSVGVEYPHTDTQLDPYFFGLWVGDGTKSLKTVQITNVDPEVETWLREYAKKLGMSIQDVSSENRAACWSITTPAGMPNPLLQALRIAHADWTPFLVNSRKVRLEFLAGILDADGHYVNSRNQYELTMKNKAYVHNIYMLVRSLGFGCSPPKEKRVKLSNGVYQSYWRIHIRGVAAPTVGNPIGVAGPPCRIARKRAVGLPKKCARRTKFDVVDVGVGPYSGFTLDGDGRFLLEDYTVTHNTEIACAVTQYLGLKTLFIVTSVELLHQAQKRFMTRLNKTAEEVGVVGDGIWQPGTWITIATLPTLERRINTPECQDLLKQTEVLFIDECVAPNSQIHTSTGSVMASDLVVGDVVETPCGFERVTYVGTRQGPGVRITTQYGQCLTVSMNHPIAVYELDGSISFVHAGLLTENDLLVEYRNPNYPSWSLEEYLVGLFAGDGCWHSPSKIRWSFRKDVDWWTSTVVDLLHRAFDDVTVEVTENKRGDTSLVVSSEAFLALLSDWGFSCGAKIGRLPIPKRSFSYIGGLFDAEGSTDSQGRVALSTTDRAVMESVLIQLRSADIEASFQHIDRTSKNQRHADLYRVTVPAKQAQMFHTLCGTQMPRKQRACKARRQAYNRGLQVLGKALGIRARRKSVVDVARITGSSTTKPVAIRSIELVANAEFVSIETSGSHTYVANNLLQHNCHHVGSETWYTVSTLCNAYYRFGLSGTPLDRTDGADLRLIAATGDILVNISNKFLVDRGISARGHIIFDKVTEPQIKKGSRYPTVYKQGVVENPQMLEKVVQWTKVFHEVGLSCLILCEEIQHGRLIDDALWTQTGGVFIPHQFIYGDEDSDTRQKALTDFASRNLPVLIASTILDEGVDVPTIDALILAGSRKSRIRTMQRLGRGLRGERLVVVEFSNFCHKYLIEHSLTRLEDYKKEECFPIYSSGPDADLVRKIWNGENDVVLST